MENNASIVTNVLIVEDNPTEMLVLRDLIRSNFGETVNVIPASSLEEARGFFLRSVIDVVILDLTLPDAANMEALKIVRRLSTNVPIIICTGNEDETTRFKSVAIGAFHFVSKSELSEMPKVLVSAIEERHIRRHDLQLVFDRLERITQVTERNMLVCEATKVELDKISVVVFGASPEDKGLLGEAVATKKFRGQMYWILGVLISAVIAAIVTSTVSSIMGVLGAVTLQ